MKRTVFISVWLLAALGSISAEAETITIVNDSDRTLYEIYVSPSAGTAWGEDLLGDAVLRPAEEIAVPIKAPGRYDVMAIDEFQRQYYIAQEELADGARVRVAAEQRRDGRALPDTLGYGWIRLRNDTGFAVHYVYVSPGYADSWQEGEQVLPSDRVLEPGDEFLVQIDLTKYRTTVFDFLLIDEDRDRYTKWDVDMETEAILEVTLEDIRWN